MTNYYNSRIGSTHLSASIVKIEPLQVCTDRITEVKPSLAIELGCMFEELVQATFTDIDLFWDKYFLSNFQTYPSGILELLELEGEELKTAIDGAYVYNKPKKRKKTDTEDPKPELNKTYERKHGMLKQIQGHEYRRPITTEQWSTLELMLERFKAMPFTIGGQTFPLETWMEKVKVQFQIEHFWSTGNAECRAKFDMIWTWAKGGKTYGVCFDLKATGDMGFGFGSMWRNKYIWQTVHYADGWEDYCQENNIIPVTWPEYDRDGDYIGSGSVIWYIVQESGEPCVTHVKGLKPSERERLKAPYYEALEIIQNWIDAGKPIVGHTQQELINIWGK